jgi:hypothetical protein
MTTKDLIFVANILLDCEEMARAGMHPILKYIKDRCKEYKIEECQGLIIDIIKKCTPVYVIGDVEQTFESDSA